jgi:hypothetical protein
MTYLSIICGAGDEERMEGVIAWDNEAGDVDEELAGDVEEDQEEIGADQPEKGVGFGDGGLSLQLIKDGVFGKLFIPAALISFNG